MKLFPQVHEGVKTLRQDQILEHTVNSDQHGRENHFPLRTTDMWKLCNFPNMEDEDESKSVQLVGV